MKSRVISYPAISEIKLRDELCHIERADIDEAIEKELDFLRREHSEIRERAQGESVQEGDSLMINVTCSAADAPKKYNKQGVGLNLGKFFYDRNIEKALTGAAVGSTVSVLAGTSGEWPVTVEIASARHTVFKELTEEDYIEASFDLGADAHNEEEFRELLAPILRNAENFNHFYDNVIDEVAEELVSGAEFEIAPEELEAEIEEWRSTSSDDYPDETEEELRAHCEQAFKFDLILLDLASDVPPIGRDVFEESLAQLREEGYAEDVIEAANDYERYVTDNRLQAGQEILRAEIEKQFTN